MLAGLGVASDAEIPEQCPRLERNFEPDGTVPALASLIERDSLPTVEGDENQLRQVFQNLLSNAIEYSGDQPPQIYISSERDGKMWTLAVHDEGIGIDSSDTDRIFNIFQRLQSDNEQPGSRIGLAVCRRIIERHNGEIWVESEPGEGSSFFFTLPASKQEPNFSAIGMNDS